MKKFILPCFLLTSTIQGAGIIQSQKVQCPTGRSGYGYIGLTPDFYRFADAEMSNLRLSRNGKPVPYFLRRGREITETKKISARAVTIRFQKDAAKNRVIQEFSLSAEDNRIPVALEAELEQADQARFSRRITLYGRDDSGNWRFLVNDSAYALPGLKKTTIRIYSQEKFRHFRLEMEGLEMLRFGSLLITGTDLSYNTLFSQEMPVELKSSPADKHTELKLENPDRLRLHSLRLQIAKGANFSRSFAVFRLLPADKPGAREIRDKISDGILLRENFGDQSAEKTEINLGEFRDSHLVISIYNGDDSPLGVEGGNVRYFTDRVYFQIPGSALEARLTDETTPPEYDIVNFSDKILASSPVACELRGEVLRSSGAKSAQAWLDPLLWRWILNGVMIVTAGILIFLLVGKLRRS